MSGIITRFKRGIQRKTQKKHTAFEFIDWLKFANAGMLDVGNLYCFEYAKKIFLLIIQ